MEPGIFKYLKDDNDILEKTPLEKLANDAQFCAYKHNGFWSCMDHKIDKDKLDEMCKENNTPWIKK